MAKPKVIIEPVTVSAVVESTFRDMIKDSKLEIRTLLERGFEVSIPKGVEAFEYVRMMKDRDIARASIKLQEAKIAFDEAQANYDILVNQREMMKNNSLEMVEKKTDGENFLLDHAKEILSTYTIKQPTWKGDEEVIIWIFRKFKVEITFDQVYHAYDQMQEKAGIE